MSRAIRVIAVAAVLAIVSLAIGQGEDEFRPGPFFEQKCSTCHVLPNPDLPTDRAWADQVLRTT